MINTLAKSHKCLIGPYTQDARKSTSSSNVGALIIRIGFWWYIALSL